MSDTAETGPRAMRRDAVRNYYRILEAAREVLGESGADASMEEIAARAGVGVGTVYRRFASKDALVDELVRMVAAEVLAAAEQALAREGGNGLEEFLREVGELCTRHGRYAHLLLQRPGLTFEKTRSVIEEITRRALAAGTLSPDMTVADVLTLISAMRELIQVTTETDPDSWRRFLDIHLAGMRRAVPNQRSALRN